MSPLMSSSVLVGHCEHNRQSIQNLSSPTDPLTVLQIILTNPPPNCQFDLQSWLDIVNTINRDSALYGIGLAPLQLDPLMPEPINIDQEMVGYQVSLLTSPTTNNPKCWLPFLCSLVPNWSFALSGLFS